MTVSLLLILKSKNNHLFNANKIKIYLLGFISIIFLELSSKFINTNLIQNLILIILPILFVLIMYVFFLEISKEQTNMKTYLKFLISLFNKCILLKFLLFFLLLYLY